MLSTSMMKLRPHPHKLDSPRLLLFPIAARSSPTASQRVAGWHARDWTTAGIAASLRDPYLSLAEQQAIAAVLGSLDDKIEQNRRTGRALEGLARATFKAWFVDFEPVKAKAAGQTTSPACPPPPSPTYPPASSTPPRPSARRVGAATTRYSAAKFINGAAFKSRPAYRPGRWPPSCEDSGAQVGHHRPNQVLESHRSGQPLPDRHRRPSLLLVRPAPIPRWTHSSGRRDQDSSISTFFGSYATRNPSGCSSSTC